MATKAKAKRSNSSSKKFSKVPKSKAPLPKGFKVIGRAPNWNPEKNPVLQGERGKTKTVVLDEGTRDEREVRIFVLDDEEIGAVNVWESSYLTDLFDNTDDGDVVRIEFLGYGKAKKGQNPPKLFECGVSK